MSTQRLVTAGLALLVVLSTAACGPDKPTPARTATPSPSVTAKPSPSATKTPTPSPTTALPTTTVPPAATPPPPPPQSVYFANCAEAKRAGAAPLHRGEPGYRSGLDRDGDGVACES